MSQDILEFLNELDPLEIKKVFNLIWRKNLKIQFTSANNQKVETVSFVATDSVNRVEVVFKDGYKVTEELTSFKIKIGTDVYFFKTKVNFAEGRYFVKGPFKIYKLVRRKNTRYAIPEAWPQSAHILLPERKIITSKVKILDISISGAKVLLEAQIPKYEKKQKIQFCFRIQRRPTIMIDATIMHIKQNENSGPTLGIEFDEISTLIKNKIQNICDDLILLNNI